MSTTELAGRLDWRAKQVLCVIHERTNRRKTSTEVVSFVTSLRRERADASPLLSLIRRHWGAIENRLHLVRDEVLGEDRSTIAFGHAPQN